MDFLNSQGEQDASVGQWVGEGVYGNVFVVRQNNGQSYSKKVFLPQFSSSMHHERQFLEQLHHPNIVTLYGHDEEPSCTLYLEVLEKTVGQAYCEEGCDHTRLLKNTLLHISHALLHLADHRIVHMDIKKDNVMLRSTGEVVLIDFGRAWHLDGDRKIQDRYWEKDEVPCGAYPLQSPEVLEILVRDYQHLKEPIKGKLRGLYFTDNHDVYCLGAMIHELVCGQYPNGNLKESQTSPKKKNATSIIDEEFAFLKALLANADSDDYFQRICRNLEPLPGNMMDIVIRMLERDLTKRSNALDVYRQTRDIVVDEFFAN